MTAFDAKLLEQMRDRVNRDPSFKALGSADARVGIRTAEHAYLVTFEAFECAAVEEVEIEALRDADFHLELPGHDWPGYLDGRRRRSAPSLLSLDLDTPGGIVRGSCDPRRQLEFERFHSTLQAFIDAGAAAPG